MAGKEKKQPEEQQKKVDEQPKEKVEKEQEQPKEEQKKVDEQPKEEKEEAEEVGAVDELADIYYQGNTYSIPLSVLNKYLVKNVEEKETTGNGEQA